MSKRRTSRLPKELTTVTKVSKTLALLMFIVLPLCGFFTGMHYQAELDTVLKPTPINQTPLQPSPTPIP